MELVASGRQDDEQDRQCKQNDQPDVHEVSPLWCCSMLLLAARPSGPQHPLRIHDCLPGRDRAVPPRSSDEPGCGDRGSTRHGDSPIDSTSLIAARFQNPRGRVQSPFQWTKEPIVCG